MGRHQVGQGERLDCAHEGQGAAHARGGVQGLREQKPTLAGAHGNLRQAVLICEKRRPGCHVRAAILQDPMSMAPATTHAEPELAAFGAQDRILEINNIEVIYDHVILVLKGVSLAVPRGGIVALLGANGAGKTTTLKAISNLLNSERGEVTKGSIIFDGQEVQARSPNDL